MKTKQDPKIKKGEWCFCEFELSQIVKTQENRITERTNGYISHSGHDLSDRCFPLDVKIKRISEEVEYWSKAFHSLKTNSLNHPDLHRELVSRWAMMCENKDNEDEVNSLFESLRKFGQAVLDKVNEAKGQIVEGVSIFK